MVVGLCSEAQPQRVTTFRRRGSAATPTEPAWTRSSYLSRVFSACAASPTHLSAISLKKDLCAEVRASSANRMHSAAFLRNWSKLGECASISFCSPLAAVQVWIAGNDRPRMVDEGLYLVCLNREAKPGFRHTDQVSFAFGLTLCLHQGLCGAYSAISPSVHASPHPLASGLEVHPAAGHGRCCRLLLRHLGHHGLSGDEQARDRRRALQRCAHHLGGVDDALGHEVAVLAVLRVEAVIVLLLVEDPADHD